MKAFMRAAPQSSQRSARGGLSPRRAPDGVNGTWRAVAFHPCLELFPRPFLNSVIYCLGCKWGVGDSPRLCACERLRYSCPSEFGLAFQALFLVCCGLHAQWMEYPASSAVRNSQSEGCCVIGDAWGGVVQIWSGCWFLAWRVTSGFTESGSLLGRVLGRADLTYGCADLIYLKISFLGNFKVCIFQRGRVLKLRRH